jgi:hypothetical protein
MKKVLGILAVSAALVGFSACGGDDGGSDEAKGDAAANLVAFFEEGAAETGASIDADCITTKLMTLSVAEIDSLLEAQQSLRDTGSAGDVKTTEKAVSVMQELGTECMAAAEEATDETSEDMTEETTP